jgi:hypothetical protein
MTFARPLALSLSLSLCTMVLSACTGSESPAPEGGSDPFPAAPPALPPAPVAEGPPGVEATPPPAAPSFTVSSEELEREGRGEPAGQSPLYKASLDATTLEQGKASMLLASLPDATTATFAATTATRRIDATVAGRRYRMRARIKTDDATSAFLWWRIDGLGTYKLDNMANPVGRRIAGTQDWREVALVMDVPAWARAFAFGSGLRGQGKVWVGAMTFEEVGADVPVTPSIQNVP